MRGSSRKGGYGGIRTSRLPTCASTAIFRAEMSNVASEIRLKGISKCFPRMVNFDMPRSLAPRTSFISAPSLVFVFERVWEEDYMLRIQMVDPSVKVMSLPANPEDMAVIRQARPRSFCWRVEQVEDRCGVVFRNMEGVARFKILQNRKALRPG